MLFTTGCAGTTKEDANQTTAPNVATATPVPTAAPADTTTGTVSTQSNDALAFRMDYNSDSFTYSEYNEGVTVASFTAEKGISGNILLSVATRETTVAETIEQFKMQQYVQTSTTEDAIIGKAQIPVTMVRIYDKSMSDVVTYGYVWEQEIDGKAITYIIEVYDRMGSDGKETHATEFQAMLNSFEFTK